MSNAIKKDKGLVSKLNKVFFIQLIFISLATIGGVFGAAKVVENVLIKQALQGEAQFFWEHRAKNPDFPLPKTMNLTGYMVNNDDFSQVPAPLAQMQESYQRVELNHKMPIAYVTQKGNQKLFLVFEEAQVSKLAFYFGITPLVIVLLVIYLPAFVSYVYSKRALSPILQLVRKLEQVDISQTGLSRLHFDDLNQNANNEIATLVATFENVSGRIAEFVNRERNFSRYAGHELRTPLAVLKGNIELLKKQPLAASAERLVNRMEPMVVDMQSLIEALLVLSRENQVTNQQVTVVNDLLRNTIEQAIALFPEKTVHLTWQARHLIEAPLSEQLFAMIISNLVRNACLYSGDEPELTVTIDHNHIIISDKGKGMDARTLARIKEPFYRGDEFAEKGFGLGLSIVDWLCQQCGWQVAFESQLNEGTTVTLTLTQVNSLATQETKQ
ncbi:MAG: sensor histidine kinase [Proteobacteria bacterium]|nr:MAG: sensor histidine kinase [Pseudomonadota bacterium]